MSAHTFTTAGGSKYQTAALSDGRKCQRDTSRTGSRRYYIETSDGHLRIVPIGAANLRARIDEAIDKAAS